MAKRHPDYGTTLYSTVFGVASAVSGTAAFNAATGGYNNLITAGWVAATVFSAGFAVSPFFYGRRYKARRSRFENLTDFSRFQISETGQMDGVTSYIAKWKEIERQTFIFYPTNVLPLHGPLPLSTFRKIVEIGWHRQMNAEYGKRGNLIETGTGRHIRLHPNQAWSRNYFTKHRRGQRRFTADHYEDAVVLLIYGEQFYHYPNRLTFPGRLIDPLVGVGKIVDRVLTKYRAHQTTPLPRRRYTGVAAKIAPLVHLVKPQQAAASH